MGVIQKLSDNIKKGVRNWLNITPSNPYSIQITEVMDFELNAIRNRIWLRGDSNELTQLYRQSAEYADRYKFWASQCSAGMEMRKIHTGLPSLIVRVLTAAVMADMNDIEFEDGAAELLWNEISKDNDFLKTVKTAVSDALAVGDGAFKISIDTDISLYPLIEWYPAEKIELVHERGRLKEIVFKTSHIENGHRYVLNEYYGYGYVKSELYCGDKPVELNAVKAFEGLKPVETFDNSVILAMPFKIFDNPKYRYRGGSIFDGKLDSFDAFDEVWSQWMDALRAGRTKTYIPEDLIPREPKNGTMLKANPFDNRFIETGSSMSEQGGSQITVQQPTIPHDSYLASYVTALDLCLQGIISPSTLGIDMKKLDNAEAQREKEKATLYTRNAVVDALQNCIPQLISSALNAYNMLNGQPVKTYKIEIPFGEYANPSFESQVETVSKAKQGGIMSIEASVDELYGDTKDREWKDMEVARLKEEQGISSVDEPVIDDGT